MFGKGQRLKMCLPALWEIMILWKQEGPGSHRPVLSLEAQANHLPSQSLSFPSVLGRLKPVI